MSNINVIEGYYLTVLNRPATPAEANGWANLVNSGVVTMAQVQSSIVNSFESINNVVPILEMFQADLGRVPLQSGLNFWVTKEDTGVLTLPQLALAIAGSAGSQAFYGTTVDAGFITHLYQNVLGIAPPPGQVAYWLAQSQGGMTQAQIEEAFRSSPAALARAFPAAINFLNNAAEGTPGVYSGSLYAGAPGPTYVLTAGIDDPPLAGFNNTIEGTANGGIAAPATYSAGDTIVAPAGSTGNTLDVFDSGTGGTWSNATDVAGVTVGNIQTFNLTSAEAISGVNTALSNEGFAGLTALNVHEENDARASQIMAGAATNIGVTTAQTTGALTVLGGDNVVVTSTGETASGATIAVGSSTAAPVGTVTVTDTSSPTTGTVVVGAINVTGGTAVSVTENLLGAPTATVTGGAVNVTGTAATTSVSVTQTPPVTQNGNVTGVVDGTDTVTDANDLSTYLPGSVTTVSLTNYGAGSTVDSGALNTLNLAGAGGSLVVTDGALTVPAVTTLALNVAGLNAASTTLDSHITTLNLATSAAPTSIVPLVATGVTTLNITGPAGLSLYVPGNDLAPVAAIVATTATGRVAVYNQLGTGQAFTGGSNNDTVTIGATTTAIAMAGGDDTVTLNAPALGQAGSLDGGTGTNRLNMSSVNAAAITAGTPAITNFERLFLSGAVGVATTDTVNLAELGGLINFVSTAGTAGPATNETETITFVGLTPGQSLTIAGLTVEATTGADDASDVATAFRTGIVADGLTLGGTVTGYTVTGSGSTDVFTSTTAGPVGPLTLSTGANPAPSAPVPVVVPGAAATPETATYTFVPLLLGQGLSIDGVTVTDLIAGDTAADVANAFISGTTTASLNVIGSDTNYTAEAVNGQPDEVQYTNTALGPMSDPVQTPILVPAPPAPTETIVAAADATQETATYTFAPLLPGQGLMIDGVTVTDLVVGDSAADVADAFISGTPAPTLGISGSDTNYTVAGASSPALQDEAVFTAIASGPVGDPSESEVPVPPPSSPTGTIVAGADATPETATYTFVPLLPGQGLTIDGVTVTPLTGSDTAAEVASAFISDRGNADLSVTGSDTAYTVTAVNGQAAEAEFTANTLGPNTDPVEVVTNAVVAPAPPSTSVTPGANITNETATYTFVPLTPGQAITIDGVTVTDLLAGDTAASVATAFITGNTTATLRVTGVDAFYTVGHVFALPNEAIFTNILAGPQSDPVESTSGVGAPSAPGQSLVDGNAATNETATYTFVPLLLGQSLTIDGVTVTDLIAGDTAANVATAFISHSSTSSLGVSGSDAAYTVSVAGLPNEAVFTATATGPNSDPTQSSLGVPTPTAPGQSISGGVAATYELATYTFSPLLLGQSLSIDGVTVTAITANDTGAEIASAFIFHGGSTNVSESGSDSAYMISGVPGQSTEALFTANTAGLNSDPVEITPAVAPPSAPTQALNLGTNGTPSTTTYTFTNFDLGVGQSITIAGRTVQAFVNPATADDVASAFEGVNAGSAIGSGNLLGYTVAPVVPGTVEFVSDNVGFGGQPSTGSTNGGSIPVPSFSSGSPATNLGDTVTFSALNPGQSITIQGVTVTALTNSNSAADVATAFVTLTTTPALSVTGGSYSGFARFSVGGQPDEVQFISFATGSAVQPPNITEAGTAAATPVTPSVTAGQAATTKTDTITFNALLRGQTVTVGGESVLALGNATAAQVAIAFINDTSSPLLTIGGALTNYTASTVGQQPAEALLTATMAGVVGDPAITGSGVTAPTPITPSVVEGQNATSVTDTITFAALGRGQSITIDGVTVAALTSNDQAAEVATAFVNGLSTINLHVSGNYANYSATAGGSSNQDVFTALTPGQVDFPSVTENGTAAPTIAPPTVVAGAAATNETDAITFLGLAPGQSITIDGRTVAALTPATAGDVATAFLTGTSNGFVSVTGSFHLYTPIFFGSGRDLFTANASGTVADPVITEAGTAAPATVTPVVVGGLSATQKTDTVTFTQLLAGQSLTIDGVTVTATSADSATDVATAFFSGSSTANLTVAGNYANYSASVVQGQPTELLYTSTGTGAAILDPVVTPAGTVAPPPPAQTVVAGLAATPETDTVSFSPLLPGQSITIDGVTVAALTSADTAADVANAFTGITAASLTVSGRYANFTAAAVNGQPTEVLFTSNATGLGTPDPVVTPTGTDAPTPIVPTVIAGTSATFATDTFTFTALLPGQGITIAGRTVTAVSSLATPEAIATAFVSNTDPADVSVSGHLAGYTVVNNNDGSVTFTSTTSGVVADLTATGNGATAPGTPSDTIVNGIAASVLALTNLASGGSVQLTAPGVVSVGVIDAGPASVLNLDVTASGALAAGSVTATGVGIVNFITSDTEFRPTGVLDSATLTDDAATTITVSGNAGLNLTTDDTALTTFDASGVGLGAVDLTTAALTSPAVLTGSATGGDVINAAAATAGVTINGGNGNATLTGSATVGSTLTGGNGNDTLTGGASSDTITAGTGTNAIDGGGGPDTIILTAGGTDTIALYGGPSNTDSITGFVPGASGDVLNIGGASLLGSAFAGTVTAAAAASSTILAAGGGNVYTADFASAIASTDFTAAGFGSLFGVGQFLSTTALTSGAHDFVAVQGTDETMLLSVAGTGSAIVAGDVSLAGVLNGVTDSSTFLAHNFA